VQPLFFGPVRDAWGPSNAEGMSIFAGVLAVAASIAVAAHVVVTRRWRSREACFATMGLAAIAVIFEWPLVADAFHFLVPLGEHARLRLVLAGAMAILTAAAIDLTRTSRAPLLAGVGLVAVALAVLIFGVDFPAEFLDRRPFVLRAAIPALVVLVTATAFALTRARAALAALLIAVVADLWVAGRAFNPPTPDSLLFARTPIIEKLRSLTRAAKEPVRVTGHGAMLFQNAPAVFGLEDIRVHDPMASHRYLEFLATTSKYDPAEYFGMWNDNTNRVLDFLNVRYLATDPSVTLDEQAGRWTRIYDGADGRIYENRDVLPRFFAVRNVLLDYSKDGFTRKLGEMNDKWSHTAMLDSLEVKNRRITDDFFAPRAPDAPLATVTVTGFTPTDYRLRAAAPRYTLVASSIPWWPGWRVEINGKRVDPIRVNGAFLGFPLPPGPSDVRVRYDPWTFRLGMIVAGATLLVLCALPMWMRRVEA
jgi:hypothetical protein